MSVKLKWKVADAPTGRYRAFEHRGWPTALYAVKGATHDRLLPAAFLQCQDDYTPSRAREGQHREITIVVLWHRDPKHPSEVWHLYTLKRRATTLDEAKHLVQQFVDSHPEWHPKENGK